MWANDRYRCAVEYGDGGRAGLVHLSIHSHSRRTAHPWRHFQQIKNDVMGDEREAVEIYPRESRLYDTANEYHLWVLAEGDQMPFGYQEREVRYEVGDPNPVIDRMLKASRARQAPEMVVKDPEPTGVDSDTPQ